MSLGYKWKDSSKLSKLKIIDNRQSPCGYPTSYVNLLCRSGDSDISFQLCGLPESGSSCNIIRNGGD